MAGIGLRLQNIIAKGTYLQSLTAYLSSAVISSGPWLSSVIAFAVLSTSVLTFLSQDARLLLFGTITYAYGVSLLISGAPQMILTRYLADRLYVDDVTQVAPTCTGVIVAATPCIVVVAPFLFFAPFPLIYRLVAVALCLTLTYIWLVVVFLSAGRDHLRILLIFIFSYVVSIGAITILGNSFGVTGSLAGFLSGQIFCLSLLIARVYREFTPNRGISFAFLSYLGTYWDLGLIGIIYTLSIWIDNAIFWWSPHGSIVIAGFFRLHPDYDATKLIAYLTTIPAAAVFLVHLEANFYRHYRDYFKSIREKKTLGKILEHKNGMMEAAQSGLVTIALIQGSVGATLYFLAPNLAIVLRKNTDWVQLLRFITIGVSVQIIMFSLFILLLYLDERRPALIVVTTFMLVNCLGTALSLRLGPAFFGMGYLLGAGVATSLGIYYLTDRLQRLDYITFMTQPIQS